MSLEYVEKDNLFLVTTYVPVVFMMAKGLSLVALMNVMNYWRYDIRVLACTALLLCFFDTLFHTKRNFDSICGGLSVLSVGVLLHLMGAQGTHTSTGIDETVAGKGTIPYANLQNDDPVQHFFAVVWFLDVVWAIMSILLPFCTYRYPLTVHTFSIYLCCTLRFAFLSRQNIHSPVEITIVDMHVRVICFYLVCAVVYFCRESCRVYNQYMPVMIATPTLVIQNLPCATFVVSVVTLHILNMHWRFKTSTCEADMECAYDAEKAGVSQTLQALLSSQKDESQPPATSNIRNENTEQADLIKQLMAAKTATINQHQASVPRVHNNASV